MTKWLGLDFLILQLSPNDSNRGRHKYYPSALHHRGMTSILGNSNRSRKNHNVLTLWPAIYRFRSMASTVDFQCTPEVIFFLSNRNKQDIVEKVLKLSKRSQLISDSPTKHDLVVSVQIWKGIEVGRRHDRSKVFQLTQPIASNPGPHHFDLLDLREEGLGKLPAILEIVRSMDRFDCRFHRFSLWPSLACPATRWVVLTSLSGLQHVGFCEHRQSRALFNFSSRKVSDWQAVRLHRQSNSKYLTYPSFEVTLLVSFLITLSCHFCFNKLAKKAENEKPIDEDLVDSTGLMEKLQKRRSTEGGGGGVREPDVYDSVRGFASSNMNMRSPNGCCDDRENTWQLGSQIFLISSLKLATHRQPCNARLWMVSWQKKKSKKKWTKTPDWVECLVLAWGPLLSVDPRKKVTMTKHERRIASKLCAWFNYKKKKCSAHILFKRLILRGTWLSSKLQAIRVHFSVVDVLLTTIDTRWFMQENRS